jgi:hypothetical protein
MPSYKAKQRLSIAGQKVEPGETFEADESAVALALARGWIEEAKSEPKPRARAKRSSKS